MKQHSNLAIWIIGIMFAGCGSTTPVPTVPAKPTTNPFSALSVGGSVGISFDAFNPGGVTEYLGWRYGPSLIYNPDDSLDMWTCAPQPGVWDVIKYKRSPDGGRTWGPETVAVEPTSGSRDAYSNCDPGVFKVGIYYYLGYTSTEDFRATDNDVYVARSTQPGGPYEKWNGSGWGGNPQPIIIHDGPTDIYGAGEPSFVVKDGVIYLYYSWISRNAQNLSINETRLSTALSSDPNWPGSLSYRGIAMSKSPDANDDSTDHKYVPAWGKFIAVNTANRFTDTSYIQLWESVDGLTYSKTGILRDNLQPRAHNSGISGDSSGHFDPERTNNVVGYAYGNVWGSWPTAFNVVNLVSDPVPSDNRNLGFESPSLGAGNFRYGPTGTAWSFNGLAGIQNNGSVFGASPAPEGAQTAMIQGAPDGLGSVAQNVTLGAGTYTLTLQVARRQGQVQPLRFSVDGTQVGDLITPSSDSFSSYATASFTVAAGSHTLKLEATDSSGDNTSFVDAIDIQPASASNSTLLNASLETPSVGGFQYSPAAADWVFDGPAGIQRNGSAFGAATTSDGVQTALIQGSSTGLGSMAQTVNLSAGSYTLSLKAARRSGQVQPLRFSVDGVQVGDLITPSSDGFSNYTTASFTVSTGSHLLKLEATDGSGDNTTFVDVLSLQ